MPGELIYGARDDMIKAVTDAGYGYIVMDAELTRYGGVETRDEGLLYAKKSIKQSMTGLSSQCPFLQMKMML